MTAPVFDESRPLRYVITLLYRTDRPRNRAELIRHTLQAAESDSAQSRAR